MYQAEMPSITCPRCKRTSYNLNDVEQRYCGHCHEFIDRMQEGAMHVTSETVQRLTWFTDSPDAGHPKCICSLCGKLIEEGEIPLRLFNERDNTECRLHMNCARQVIPGIGPSADAP